MACISTSSSKVPSSCPAKIPVPGFTYTYSQILSEYLQCVKPAHDVYLNSLTNNVDYVAGAHNSLPVNNPKQIKQGGHQKRVKAQSIFNMCNVISNLPLSSYNNFDALWQDIKSHKVSGIGDVTIYDIALRWGNQNGVDPDYVYLHSDNGPLKGAKRYFQNSGNYITGINGNQLNIANLKSGMRIPKSNFPDFAILSARDIEHLLCVYHNVL